MTTPDFHRRLLIKALAATGALNALGFARVAVAAESDLKVYRLTDTLSLITGAGGNVVVFKNSEGATLIDSGDPANSAPLLQLVDEQSGGVPIRMVINTHWHEDHSGGNEALHERGAQILAHENTKLWLGAEFDVDWRQWSHQPRPANALPDRTFYTSGTLELGGERVEYSHYPQAHTDGDLSIYFPQSNVLVCGGLLANKRYPICDIATGGWIGGLIKANEAMLSQINDNTVVVPDRGPPLRKAELQAQYEMLSELYTKMKELAQQGFNDHDMLRDTITAKFDTAFGDPTEFVKETYRGMWAHTYDMGGFI